MNEEKRFEIVRKFFQAWESGLTSVRPFLTKDIVWWHPWGAKSYSNFDEANNVLWSNMAGECKLTVKSIIAQGERLAVEVKGFAPLKNGTVYDQDYFFLLEFSGDKIKLLKEYSDTKHSFEIWWPILNAAKFVG